MLKIKRAYEAYETNDGYRILVDRLWPRGISKKDAHIDVWLKDIAPSTKLRQWFKHDPKKWQEFQKRYKEELQQNSEIVEQIKKIIQEHKAVSFVYAAKDELHNDALVLLNYLK